MEKIGEKELLPLYSEFGGIPVNISLPPSLLGRLNRD